MCFFSLPSSKLPGTTSPGPINHSSWSDWAILVRDYHHHHHHHNLCRGLVHSVSRHIGHLSHPEKLLG